MVHLHLYLHNKDVPCHKACHSPISLWWKDPYTFNNQPVKASFFYYINSVLIFGMHTSIEPLIPRIQHDLSQMQTSSEFDLF